MTDPGVVHFFSYVTGVSLELPVGFEFVGEDDVSASYADRADDGPTTDTTPLVRIRVVGDIEEGGELDAVHLFADGLDSIERETITRREREIDECPAITVVSRDGGRMLHQTAVAADGRLLSIIGAAPSDDLLPVFDAALDSIRLIAL